MTKSSSGSLSRPAKYLAGLLSILTFALVLLAGDNSAAPDERAPANGSGKTPALEAWGSGEPHRQGGSLSGTQPGQHADHPLTAGAGMVSCDRINPFSAGSVPASGCKQDTSKSNPEPDTQGLPTDAARGPFADLDQVVGTIANGSIRDAGDYLFMRDQCIGPLPTGDEATCGKLASVAQAFRSRLERGAQQGDAEATKLLGMELVREVQAARNEALSKAAESNLEAVMHGAQSYAVHPKWTEAMNHLRMAAVRDEEAQDLLQQFSAHP